MSSDTIDLTLEMRTTLGKGLGQLRRDGKVPAVIHDHGKASIHVMANTAATAKVCQQAGKHHPVQLTVEGKRHLALIKDTVFEPTRRNLRHVVFQAIKQNETVSAEIPVVLSGEAPAQKLNMSILQQIDVVEVEALPRDLIDSLEVKVDGLAEVGDKITIADIIVPKGITITADPELIIAIVEMPKDQLAEADAAAESLAADAGDMGEEAVPTVETPQSEAAQDDSNNDKPADKKD